MGESLITRRGGDGLGDYGWIKAFAPWNDTSLLDGYEKTITNNITNMQMTPNGWFTIDNSSGGGPSSATGKYDDVVAVVIFLGHVTFISGIQNEVNTWFDISGATYPMKIKLSSTDYTDYSTVQIWGYYSSEDYSSKPIVGTASYVVYSKPSQ